jgi:hypothetical protein
MGMLRRPATVLLLALSAGVLAACGGTAVPCAGVEVDGVCWIGRDGLTVTAERVSRIATIARRHFGAESDPAGWTVVFVREPEAHVDHDPAGASVSHVVDGVEYHGWACPAHRAIVVRPFDGEDCIERSAVFHELGHAGGPRGAPPRLYAEYPLMLEAMQASRWKGCRGEYE